MRQRAGASGCRSGPLVEAGAQGSQACTAINASQAGLGGKWCEHCCDETQSQGCLSAVQIMSKTPWETPVSLGCTAMTLTLVARDIILPRLYFDPTHFHD